MVGVYCDLIASLPVLTINAVINKDAVYTSEYEVIDRTLTFSIQRVENDLSRLNPKRKSSSSRTLVGSAR